MEEGKYKRRWEGGKEKEEEKEGKRERERKRKRLPPFKMF